MKLLTCWKHLIVWDGDFSDLPKFANELALSCDWSSKSWNMKGLQLVTMCCLQYAHLARVFLCSHGNIHKERLWKVSEDFTSLICFSLLPHAALFYLHACTQKIPAPPKRFSTACMYRANLCGLSKYSRLATWLPHTCATLPGTWPQVRPDRCFCLTWLIFQDQRDSS